MIKRILLAILNYFRGLLDPDYAKEKKAYEEYKKAVEQSQKEDDIKRTETERKQQELQIERGINDIAKDQLTKQIEKRNNEAKVTKENINNQSDAAILRDKL